METNLNKNTIYNTIKTIFNIIFPLITFPYIARILLPENVGKINFGNSIIGYFSLIASLGITVYAVRECSKVRDNKLALETIASQLMSINIITTVISYIGLILLLLFMQELKEYRILICIQSLVIVFTTLGADWLNTAMEDFKYIALRTVGWQIISLILMFLFIHEPDDYLKYVIITVFAASGANIANIYHRKKYCELNFTTHIEYKKHIKPILIMFSMILTQYIFCYSDITVLGLIKGDFEVGLYSTTTKIYFIVNSVVASIAWVLMPQLTENFSKNNYEEINRLLKYGFGFICTLGIPCLVGLNAIAKEIILLIAGEKYIGAVYSLHILTIALLFSFIGGFIGNMILLPSGKEKICLISGIVCAGTNVVLNLLFIPDYGLNAAAATTAVSQFIGFCWGIPYIDKKIQIPNIKENVKAPVIGGVGIWIIAIVVKQLVDNPLFIAVLTIFFSIVIYSLILIVMKNDMFLNFISPIFNKFYSIWKYKND